MLLNQAASEGLFLKEVYFCFILLWNFKKHLLYDENKLGVIREDGQKWASVDER